MGITFVSRGKPCCINCGAPADEQHHVVPRSVGGLATVHLCNTCHGLAHGMHRADIRELTRQGLQRARAAGKVLGRPSALTEEQQTEVLRKLAEGATVYALAQEFNVDRRSIRRVRDNANASADA